MVTITRLKYWHWLCLGIGLFALFLRLMGNTQSPPSLYWEEVALGYDAYSILQTGKDHHGNNFPVVAFPSFGDFKPSLYFYSLIPSIATFGLTPFAVRLPAALASAGTVIVGMVYARKLTNSTVTSTLAGLLLAIQPWSLLVGRAGFEVNLATFLLLLGTVLWWHALQQIDDLSQRKFWIPTVFAVTFLALSMYAYHGMRVLAPLFAVTTFITQLSGWKLQHFSVQKWQKLIGTALLACVFILPILRVISQPEVQQRVRETSLFTIAEPVERANEYRERSGNSIVSKVLFHRYFFWGELLTTQYLHHFTPQFLFITGDRNPRHASQYLGMLYPWESITLLLGLLALTAKGVTRKTSLFFILLLLSPVAAMVTQATPHALRALPLSFFLAILSAVGIEYGRQLLQAWVKKNLPPLSLPAQQVTWIVIGSVLLASVAILLHYTLTVYPSRYAHEWQYGYKEMISSLNKHQQPGEPLFVSRSAGRPAMYVLFFQQTDPRIVQEHNDSLPKDQQELLALPGWTFYDGVNMDTGLHAAPENLVPSISKEIDRILRPDGTTAWVIYR